MKLKLFNTETRELQVVQPMDGKTVRMYTCGPTIYDFAHIGNFRTYIFEDLLRRTIQFFGMDVEQVMNITDIDDKTINGAIKKDIPLKEFTDPFRVAFFEDLSKLNIEKAEHYPNATDYIAEMIQMIETLIEKGFAYKSSDGSIYFSIRHFPSYGRLARLEMDQLKVNASGDNNADEYGKENVSDFVLWKAYDKVRDGKIYWDSPFGPGRPGWHIECSAMATKLLGPSIDIHCGGVDNLFPHHENEIAQSECCTGHKFVGHWLHSEHLLVDHKKMSKSLGNFYTLRDLIQKGFTGGEVRYLLLSSHYRVQLNFTFAGLEGARAALHRFASLFDRLRAVDKEGALAASATHLENAEHKFKEALSEDLNTSVALAALFDLIRELNALIDAGLLTKGDATAALALFERLDKVLGVLPLHQKEEFPPHLVEILQKREQARKEKNWKLSDEFKNEILAAGFIVEDSPTGSRLKRK